jgi:Uma2 family endonuclease
MGAAETLPLLSLEEYLQLEEQAEYKSEYHAGYIVAMAGATRNHSLIGANMLRGIGNALSGSCEVHGSDLKVYIDALTKSLYPDVTVICGAPEFGKNRKDLITNPSLLIEVLSESTEAFDRGDKFSFYRHIPSLREYVLVSQKKPMIESFFKTEGGFWKLNYAEGIDSEIHIESLGLSLPLAEVYRGVEWEG